ncbi:MAG: transporter substrate-binding domain-containing protein [Bacteroidales bacterium]|nr:transporter substrate-binding domain-containing protein [Bacteroidales bacterium]
MINIKHKRQRHIINVKILYAFLIFVGFAVIYDQVKLRRERDSIVDLHQMEAEGELRALTLYSPTTYFIYRDKEMGYEYEICSEMAKSLGLKLKMVVAPNQKAMMEMLERGEGDLIANNIPITLNIKNEYLFCGREYLTHQVLVQRKNAPSEMLTDVTDLIGKEVLVQSNTTYETRLRHLNNEIGGGILIQTVNEDSLSVEDMIEMVAMGKIDYTIADNNIAQFNKTYYSNISTSLMLGFNQHSSWVVRKSSPLLAEAINKWFRDNVQTQKYKLTNKRYFELMKGPSPFRTSGLNIGKNGQISAYDELFRKYARKISWDWRLLASIAYQESNLDPHVTNSWTGASGLMQIMPKTARSLGLDMHKLLEAETSILGAAKLLKTYERGLSGVTNQEQRTKMTLASYNCGFGHILDARALARKYKKNPNLWDGDNVGKFIYLKSRPEYYQDPVCKQGYLRGSETAAFVTEVWTRYKYYSKKVPL